MVEAFAGQLEWQVPFPVPERNRSHRAGSSHDASSSIGWGGGGRTSSLQAGGSRADGQLRRQRNRFSARSCLQSWQRVPHVDITGPVTVFGSTAITPP